MPDRSAAPRDRPQGVLRESFARWALARHLPGDSTRLGQRNVYILPSRAGWLFALTLLVLLLGSINYQLNLGYLFTFALTGSALMSMYVTHANLRGLQLDLPAADEAELYAAQPALLRLRLRVDRRARWGLLAHLDGAETRALDLEPGRELELALPWTPSRRGPQPWPALRLETRFPLGLWRAWSVWRPSRRICVYPTPLDPGAALPAAQGPGGEAAAGRGGEADELDDLRPWRSGDPLRRVVWRKSRDTAWVVRSASASAPPRQLWLDWDALPANLDAETRLRQLCAWVLLARRGSLRYGLRMPGSVLPPGEGDDHARACLRLLAGWGLEQYGS